MDDAHDTDLTLDEGSAERLLIAIGELARRLAATHGVDDLLQCAIELATVHVDGCDGGSVMLVRKGGRISLPASTSPTAMAIDRAQVEADEGPCLESLREHHTVVISDLQTEERWPRYRAAALEAGARSTLSVRLFLLEDTMGSLNLYSSSPAAFGPAAIVVSQVLASHAAVALKAAITEAGLTTALETRDVIGQAKGVLMSDRGLTAEAAFERLRQVSQRQNRPLRELAREVSLTGELIE